MDQPDNIQIEQLLERFFNGETTHEEEQVLYTFFRQETVPEALEPYKAVFRYFEQGIREEAAEAKPRPVKKKTIRRLAWISSAFAAAVLLAFVLLHTFLSTDKDDFNPYEGSYMRKDGVRICNTRQLMQEEKLIEALMMQKQKEIERIDDTFEAKETEVMKLEQSL